MNPIVKECLDTVAAALPGNAEMFERYAPLTYRTVTLSLIVTVGRLSSFVVDRETAIRWFTRAFDNDPGFGFKDDDEGGAA